MNWNYTISNSFHYPPEKKGEKPMKLTKLYFDKLLSGDWKPLVLHSEEGFAKLAVTGHPGVKVVEVSKKGVKLIPILQDDKGDAIMEGDILSETGWVDAGSTFTIGNWETVHDLDLTMMSPDDL